MAGGAKEFLIKIVSSFLGRGTEEAKKATEELADSTKQATEATEENTEATKRNSEAQEENAQETGSLSNRTGILAGVMAGVTVKALNLATKALNWLKNEAISTITTFAELQQNTASLNQTLQNFEGHSEKTSRSLQRLARSLSRSTATPERTWLGVFQRLIQQGVSSGDVPRYAASIEHLAGLMGGDIAQAANLFSQAIAGNFSSLGQYGIVIKDTTDKGAALREVMQQLADKGMGVLASQQETLAGRGAALSQVWNEVKSGIGQVAAETGVLSDAYRWLMNDLRMLSSMLNKNADDYGFQARQQAAAARHAKLLQAAGGELTEEQRKAPPVIDALSQAYERLAGRKQDNSTTTKEEIETLKEEILTRRELLYQLTEEEIHKQAAIEAERLLADQGAKNGQIAKRNAREAAEREREAEEARRQRLSEFAERGAQTEEELRELHELSIRYLHEQKATEVRLQESRAQGYRSETGFLQRAADLLGDMFSGHEDIAASMDHEQQQEERRLQSIIDQNKEYAELAAIARRLTHDHAEAAAQTELERSSEAAHSRDILKSMEGIRTEAESLRSAAQEKLSLSTQDLDTLEQAYAVQAQLETKYQEQLTLIEQIIVEDEKKAALADLDLVYAERRRALGEQIKRLESNHTAQQRAVSLDHQRLRAMELRARGLDAEADAEERAVRRAELISRYEREHGTAATQHVDRLMAAEDAVTARRKAEEDITKELAKQQAIIDKQIANLEELERQAKARGASTQRQTTRGTGGRTEQRLIVDGTTVYDTRTGVDPHAAARAGLDLNNLPSRQTRRPKVAVDPVVPPPSLPSTPGAPSTTSGQVKEVAEAITRQDTAMQEQLTALAEQITEGGTENQALLTALAEALQGYFQGNATAHDRLKDMIAAARN